MALRRDVVKLWESATKETNLTLKILDCFGPALPNEMRKDLVLSRRKSRGIIC